MAKLQEETLHQVAEFDKQVILVNFELILEIDSW